jgi:hypothetical protein
MKPDLILKIGIIFILGIFILSFVSSATRSNPAYMQYMTDYTEESDDLMCESGQDFVIQVAPFGCMPIVRSDLLEEQNVPVFCQLAATKINPLIKVEAIDSISFSGDYPPEVEGIAFYPAQAALGDGADLNELFMNNIGYAVIVLKRQANASAMPDFVSGNLTARIRYDVESSLGIGEAKFYLPELEQSAWEKVKYQYGFWNDEGYLKAEDIEGDRAIISVYSGDNKVKSVSLDTGETSETISLPGFDCSADLKIKLNSLDNSDSRALIRVNSNVYEVVRGEKFLDNKCEVTKLEKRGLVQEVKIRCEEGGEVNKFNPIISPKIKLTIDGEEREVGVGERIYTEESKSVYLAYLGTKGDPKNSEELFVYLISRPDENKEKLDEEELNYYDSIVGELLNVDFNGGAVDGASEVLEKGSGMLNQLFKRVVDGESHQWINYGEEESFEFHEVIFNGFIDPIDSNIIEGIDFYDDAFDDYETVIDSFSGESHVDLKSMKSGTFDEEALYQEIVLAWDSKQRRTVLELCDEFELEYPSSKKDVTKYCDDNYKLSNSEIATNYVMINGRTKKIIFEGIYEPSFEDYGAKIFVQSSEETISYEIKKDELIPLDDGQDTIRLISLEQDSARIEVSVDGKQKTLTIEKDVSKSKGEYVFTLSNVNLKKIARVSVLPNVQDSGTEANFGFSIGIEKRAFQLSPEMIEDQIESLDKQMTVWQNLSNGLEITNKALQTACIATSAIFTFNNLIANAGGAGVARKYVMRGKGGWHEKCSDMVNAGTYSSKDRCLLDNSNTIDSDVKEIAEIIREGDKQRKNLEDGITTEPFLFGTSTVDTDEFMERYSEQVIDYWDEDLPSSFEDPNGNGELIIREEMLTILNYSGWKNGNYNQEQLKEIELWAMVLERDGISDDLQNLAEGELYSVLSDVKENSGNYVERTDFEHETGMRGSSLVASFEELNEIPITEKITFDQTKYVTEPIIDSAVGGEPHIESSDNVFSFKDIGTGKKYLLVYDEDGFVKKTFEINNQGLVLTEERNPLDFFFKLYDAKSYENDYKNPKLRYYETEPYKGRPAIVPFDLRNGWYAATKQTLPALGNIRAYDDSGAVSSFYLCNVGENGLEENIGGDDICEMITSRNGPFDQFEGLDEDDAEDLIDDAFRALDQAVDAYGPGLSGKVNILGERVDVGAPAVDVPGIECQDFMSPKDCQVMFNVCDPVICPSSRCDFGGNYPVKNVAGSGIVGSLLLCMPNFMGFGGDVVIPVCLTGVKAGIDGLLSVENRYRDCLQHNLDTGEMIGSCDAIYSIYLCKFLWEQAIPLADFALPQIVGAVLGQNTRGGGEYLTIVDAWTETKDSVSYFTQYYGENSFKAFKTGSTEEITGEFCKASISGVYPTGADLLDTLTEPASPAQFLGWFDEIPFSSVTVPPTSHYKVFYHIFAGSNQGAYYQVYLKGIPGSAYYQDISPILTIASGYIGIGESAEETRDLTEDSGYQQLCISVNGEEECGFKEVTTDAAIDWISDQYVAEQIRTTDIKTEKGCISGTVILFGQETIGLENYNNGIIRTCATGDPGSASDPYAGTNNSRWRQVGYCGDQSIGCWLDTESVDEIIEGAEIAEGALEDVSEDYLELLRSEGNYLTEEGFNSKIKEITKEKDFSNKIDLINEVLNKVFFNSEKAYLFLLRGNAYAGLARKSIVIELSRSSEGGCEDCVFDEACQADGYDRCAYQRDSGCYECVYDDEEDDTSGEETDDESSKREEELSSWEIWCEEEVDAGRYVDEKDCLEHVEQDSQDDNLGNEFTYTSKVWNIPKTYVIINSAMVVEKGNENIHIIKLDKSHCVNDSTTSSWFYDLGNDGVWGDAEKELYDKREAICMLPAFVDAMGGASASVGSSRVSGERENGNLDDLEMGERILQTAKDYADEDHNEFRIKNNGRKDYEKVCSRFVATVLDDVGIEEPHLEPREGPCYIDAIDNLITIFEKSSDFVEVNEGNLEEGDVVVFGRVCEKTYHTLIFSHYENGKSVVRGYGDPGGRREEVELESYRINSDEWYFHRAFRYAQGASDSAREKWTADSAIAEINELLQIDGRNSGGKYDENSLFVNEIVSDGLIDVDECKRLRGVGIRFKKTMAWLKNLLKEKLVE